MPMMMNAYRAPYPGADAFSPGLNHVFLIAIRGDPQGTIMHRGNPLRPMQVVLTGPGEGPPFAGVDAAIGPLPALPPPQRLMRTAHPSASLLPREVTGEILRDAGGRLYEKIGDHVRPVHQLCAGSRGEMLDLTPIRDNTRDASASNRGDHPAPADSHEPSAQDADAYDYDAGESASGTAPRPGQSLAERPFRELARRLAPEPGLWRLVRYADFIDVITPQLADPRRLQPGHQLACFAQIYELAVTLPAVALEQAAADELGNAGKLLPLSYDLCRRFALSLPRPALALAAARHTLAPGFVPAGARFITLRVAIDPTAESATTPPTPAEPAPHDDSPVMAPKAPEAVAATTAERRSAIPDEFEKPWDLKLGRDEALYDMTLATSRGAWQRFVDRMRNRISAADMKRWHALLSRKTLDEQLWMIKPPKGGLGDVRIRQWAEQTLRLAGYDEARMLLEWEIHWRRKGL